MYQGVGARERVLAAVTELAGLSGCSPLTVEALLVAAGVSRASFYQYFSSVEDCFRCAYREHAERLVTEVANARVHGGQSELAVLETLVWTAVRRPQAARLLLVEGLANGPAGLEEREALVARVAATSGDATEQASAIDLPPTALIGGTFRFLAMCLADGDVIEGSDGAVREWARTFERGPDQRRWSARFAAALPEDGSRTIAPSQKRGARLPLRERILRATAAVVRERGYRAMTVADIVAAAGVSRRSFYNEFAGKCEAFTATYEYSFQSHLAACTPAFFGSGTWPERVWDGVLASIGFLAREPLFAHLGLVECYAPGQGFIARAQETQLAFTLFLEEGYRQSPGAGLLPRSCSTLTAAAIMELAFQTARHGALQHIHRLQPLAVYIALAPFIGCDAAGTFVDDKLAQQRAALVASV